MLQVVPNYREPSTERTDIWVMYDGHEHLRQREVLGLGAAGPVDRQRAAPRHQPAAPERSHRRDVRHLLRSAQRLHVLHQPARRAAPTTRSSTRAAPTPTGIRCGTSQHRPLRRRLDGRDGDPVQVAALPRRAPNRCGASRSAAPIRRKNEWAYLTPVPQNLAGPQALNRVSAGGTLVGLDLPPAGTQHRAQAVRAVARVTTDRLRTPPARTTSTATSAAT